MTYNNSTNQKESGMPKTPNSFLNPLRSRWRAHLDRLLSPHDDCPESEVNLGRRLQALRQARGLSQRALAELSGLNFNTLSLIENEKTSPNVSTLQQLADALEVPVTAFFEAPAAERESVVFQKAGKRGRVAFDQGHFSDLGGGLTLGEATPLLMTLNPGKDSGDAPIVHTGVEFVYCLSGEMVFWVDGDEFHLSPGDSLIFEAHAPHRWANPSIGPAQAVLVICPADREDRSVTQHLPMGAAR
jgi:transcriptional regulator with XRE-family HTH domain